MVSSLSESDDIRRQMAQIRAELHQDVQGVVRGAEAATDWRRYVRNYPWVAIGIAFGVGYLVVPRRQKPLSLVPEGTAVAAAVPKAVAVTEPAPRKGKGLVRTMVGFAAPFALRAAQGYAMQFLEQYLAQKMAQGQNPLTDLASRFLPEGFDPAAMMNPAGAGGPARSGASRT